MGGASWAHGIAHTEHILGSTALHHTIMDSMMWGLTLWRLGLAPHLPGEWAFPITEKPWQDNKCEVPQSIINPTGKLYFVTNPLLCFAMKGGKCSLWEISTKAIYS